MAEPLGPRPADPTPGAPPPRSGRLGLLLCLAVPVAVLALATHLHLRAAPPTEATGAPAADPPSRARLAFGSVTRQGALLFRVGEPVHVWAVDPSGAVRWQRDLADGDRVACGPCPGAIVADAEGRPSAVADDGSPGSVPSVLGSHLTAATSVIGVVVAADRGPGRVEFFVPTSDGLQAAGPLADARLDQALVVVTPATDGRAVTLLRASADPLHQGEFEVVHVTPSTAHIETVALDHPAARPRPCAVADGQTVAYLQQRPGPTVDGSTHVVARRDDGRPPVDATVTGTFDSCAITADGVVLTSAANGIDGDLSRTRVDVVWLDAVGRPRASASEQVLGTSASVALDDRSARVAVAGGSGPAVLLDGSSRHERPPAAACAFDDAGGLWWADADAHVTREALT